MVSSKTIILAIINRKRRISRRRKIWREQEERKNEQDEEEKGATGGSFAVFISNFGWLLFIFWFPQLFVKLFFSILLFHPSFNIMNQTFNLKLEGNSDTCLINFYKLDFWRIKFFCTIPCPPRVLTKMNIQKAQFTFCIAYNYSYLS